MVNVCALRFVRCERSSLTLLVPSLSLSRREKDASRSDVAELVQTFQPGDTVIWANVLLPPGEGQRGHEQGEGRAFTEARTVILANVLLRGRGTARARAG